MIGFKVSIVLEPSMFSDVPLLQDTDAPLLANNGHRYQISAATSISSTFPAQISTSSFTEIKNYRKFLL